MVFGRKGLNRLTKINNYELKARKNSVVAAQESWESKATAPGKGKTPCAATTAETRGAWVRGRSVSKLELSPD